MRINTKNFGELEVDERMAIHFDNGLPGFEDKHEFVILNNWDTTEPTPFMWLQSLEDEDLAFVIAIPFFLRSDYEFDIPPETCEELDINRPNDVGVYTICKVYNYVDDMTFNLAAPIIVNTNNRRAAQITLTNTTYKVAEKFRPKL